METTVKTKWFGGNPFSDQIVEQLVDQFFDKMTEQEENNE